MGAEFDQARHRPLALSLYIHAPAAILTLILNPLGKRTQMHQRMLDLLRRLLYFEPTPSNCVDDETMLDGAMNESFMHCESLAQEEGPEMTQKVIQFWDYFRRHWWPCRVRHTQTHPRVP
jgi:hypothetical protein